MFSTSWRGKCPRHGGFFTGVSSPEQPLLSGMWKHARGQLPEGQNPEAIFCFARHFLCSSSGDLAASPACPGAQILWTPPQFTCALGCGFCGAPTSGPGHHREIINSSTASRALCTRRARSRNYWSHQQVFNESPFALGVEKDTVMHFVLQELTIQVRWGHGAGLQVGW